MKRLLALMLLLTLCLPLFAVEDGEAMYVGGTVPALKIGTMGAIDTSSTASFDFQYAGGKLVIPYTQIESYEYSQDVARHLGVLPAIAVGIVRKRERRHFIRIAYREPAGTTQVAVLEVSKHMPNILLAVLKARAPQGCKSPANNCRRYS